MPTGPLPFSETNLHRRLKRGNKEALKFRGVLLDVQAERAVADLIKALSNPADPLDVLSLSQVLRCSLRYYRDAVMGSADTLRVEYSKAREGTDQPKRQNKFRNPLSTKQAGQ